jgi:hypothetical protein
MNIEEEKESATETENVEEAELEEMLNEEPIEETAETEEKAPVEAEEAEEKKEKPAKKKKKGEEEEIVEERVYTIPLGKATVRPPKKRAPRAIQLIRAFVTKHMKVEMHLEEMRKSGEEASKNLPEKSVSARPKTLMATSPFTWLKLIRSQRTGRS